MKVIIVLLGMLAFAGQLQAQAVGIGTAAPHSSAALQVSSTTRGFLCPRMTTVQRNAIASPLNGLTVYDTDLERQYTYVDGLWRYTLTNDIWANNATAVYQASKDVGIGTAAPQEKLHVAGNIRLAGNLLSTGDININNDAALINLQSASVDKAFVQLSGDNLRVGTYSATNPTGQFIVRVGGSDRLVVESGGNVGIGNTNPAQRLDVNGSIKLTGKVLKPASGAANMLPVAYGLVTANGTLYSGTPNFTITRQQTGVYILTSADFSASTVIVATTTATGLTIGAGIGTVSNELNVYIRNDTGELTNAFFNFVAFTY